MRALPRMLSALMLLGCVPLNGLDAGLDASYFEDNDAIVTDPVSPEMCSEASKLVYVIDSDNHLYSFHPPSKQLNLTGTIDCGTNARPYSMSVSRAGIAYVLYWNGAGRCEGIYAVRASNGECLGRTRFQCGEGGTSVFGMGFASDAANSSDETLYVGSGLPNTFNAGKLWSLDIETWEATPVGEIAGAPEMSGKGDGQLWGFFAWTTPPKVGLIDKETGALTRATEHPELFNDGSFAFAHWGGDFYLFHGPFGHTTIYRLPGGQDVLETYMDPGGVNIVGAGVSTCAPTSFIGK